MKKHTLSRSRLAIATMLLGGSLLLTGCQNFRDTASQGSGTTRTASAAAANGQTSQEAATMVLHEEKLDVQKREVNDGGVVIRKDVETRQVNQPVEVRRESVQVERLTPEQARERGINTNTPSQIGKDEVFIPVTREEVVVQKEVQPREVVRAETATQTERQNVDATLRREVVDVQTQGGSAQQASTAAGRQLEQQIRTELRRAGDLQLSEEQLNQINIQVANNTVTLAGTVPNQQAASQIEQRIRQVPGVQNVQNQLRAAQSAAE
jgi:uncharacterized protein (TIGR02271 family)